MVGRLALHALLPIRYAQGQIRTQYGVAHAGQSVDDGLGGEKFPGLQKTMQHQYGRTLGVAGLVLGVQGFTVE